MNVVFDEDSLDDYLYWQTTDNIILKKINNLLKEIKRQPRSGIGKPEPLKDNRKGEWSRRINKEHRLIYRIEGDFIYIVSMRGHYSAK